jgi:hypothetical protein
MTDEQRLRDTPMYAKTMAELRVMTDDELEHQYDRMVTEMGHERIVVQLGYYLDELRRRDAARQTDAAIRLAKLTLAVAKWTLAVAVVAALIALLAVIVGA